MQMAIFRRFLNNSKVSCLRPFYSLGLLAALHTHGSPSSNPILPWVLNSPEINSNPQVSIFDLLKEYRVSGLYLPSYQHGKNLGLSNHLEQCHGSQNLREFSESATVQGFVSKFLEGPGIEEDMKIWADSVKKKRRKKMNKHKYKKLRKRLRRKSRKK